ncbi:hypothetical protein DICPUDRAFT_36733 [Dictyostelium purpureum]|uniref:FHA domain-containing protein n=1 Tax=Dictyostelium purpureum TaxID=5786 RepID=F0ZRJ3_DICPU|nr:uncharacterized protein DICPUDRAFT_36733 [Dictyostelium purpureum]EGC33417.1 hypothetical protein DICPUDRAFT_36733 [Dictyostelium purpureum]|eukprot:XP_003290036.1 hypothetical protein DICPUDRAFT_36733 [Dictyostelium purpureum]
MSYYDDDDNTLEEIKKLQEARKKGVSLYDDDDDDINNNNKNNKYDSSISTSSSKKSSSKKRSHEDEYDRHQRESIKKEFDSYSAPSHILDTLPVDDDYDPLKKYRAPTVAEQETEYRSRWRKRDLSPPRDYDPFTNKGGVKGRSFKEIMMETQLAREEKEIMMKIEKKKKDEEELAKQKKRTEEYENKKKLKKGDDNDSNGSSSGNSSSKNSKTRGDVTPTYPVSSSSSSSKWYYKVYKNGDLIENSRDIKENEILTFGRDSSRNRIVLEHPSCSSTHASISLAPDARRPVLLDLKSTNQTFLNGKEIKPHQPEDLYDGDKIQFGASTREYIIYKRK